MELDINTLLNEMSSHLKPNLKNSIDTQAIEIVAANHGTLFENMEFNVRTSKSASIFGGEVAGYYFEMLRDTVKSMIADEKELLQIAICTNFNYCQKKRDGLFDGEEYSLSLAIADSLIAFAANFPFPVTSITAYLLKTRLLNDWCSCPDDN